MRKLGEGLGTGIFAHSLKGGILAVEVKKRTWFSWLVRFRGCLPGEAVADSDALLTIDVNKLMDPSRPKLSSGHGLDALWHTDLKLVTLALRLKPSMSGKRIATAADVGLEELEDNSTNEFYNIN